ncbi:ABC transporter substrate-binding protein [Methanoculleus sp. DTU007]|uniref:ABC transporter substrate-binding protein n=1 Tax=Methanoculleus sp. DTU007 TaxID=1671626 RepID=UPI000A763CA1|nr:ABC transporter substrate-binding protein [Methanoculleus sp. DTU007]
MKKIIGLLLTLILAACLLAAGCTSTESFGSDPGKTLVVGEMWRVSSINPGDGHGGGTFITEKAIVTETLVGADANFTLVPNLATAWRQINDTTWEFDLREGVLFHNGEEMTAESVVFSLDRVAESSPGTAALLDYKSCEVVDRYTLRIHTNTLNPLVPGTLHYPDTAIIHPDSYDASGKFITPIGTGPMKLESFDEQTGEVVVVKNSEWWGGEPGLDRMIIRGYESPATRAMLAESGEVDFTVDPPYSEVDRLDAIDGIRVEKYNTPRIYKLDVNLNRPPMDDKNVRKAISHAIDRDGIVDNVLYGVGSPAGGVFLPTMTWANTTLKPYTYDPALAKQYLAESGWTDTDGDGYVDKDGKNLKVKVVTYTERPGLPPMLEAIAANLKSVGIEVETLSMENSALTVAMADGTWDLYLSATNLAMVPDPEYVLKGWYTTTGSSNTAGYSNPEVDRMIMEGHNISDLDERYDHFRRIEAIVYDDLPTINVAYYGVAVVMKDTVNGYKFDPTAHDYRIDPFMSISA